MCDTCMGSDFSSQVQDEVWINGTEVHGAQVSLDGGTIKLPKHWALEIGSEVYIAVLWRCKNEPIRLWRKTIKIESLEGNHKRYYTFSHVACGRCTG